VHGGFVAEVHRLSGHPEQLRGLISGIKGKLFEEQYVSWLNHGHLPSGSHAEMAQHANNPAWDIAIKDSHGHVDHVLQMKATESADYVRHVFETHPHIDVVTTHEIFNKLADHHSDLVHLIDSGIANASLAEHAGMAVEQAGAAGVIAFHLPVLAVGLAVIMELECYRTGRQSLAEAIQEMSKRSLMALVAATFGWVAAAAAGKLIMGLPVAVMTRIAAGTAAENLESRYLLSQSIKQIRQSSTCLATI
jgi:hypothetical protein